MSCCYSTQIAKSTGDCQKVNHPCFCYQIVNVNEKVSQALMKK